MKFKFVVALAVSVVSATASESILGATYGIAGCVGVKDTTDWDELTSRGCNVVTVQTAKGPKNVTSAISAMATKGICGLFSNVRLADGLPVTFSSPVDTSTLQASDFNFSLSDGSWVQPLCVTTRPASEDNEGNTVATLGHFGDGLKGQVYPVRLTIVGKLDLKTRTGEIVNAQGLEFTDTTDMMYMNPDSHPRMLQARLETFSTKGEEKGALVGPNKGKFPNHCEAIYGSTVTHRVRVVMSGGSTLDGVTSILPETPDLFQVLLKNGSTLLKPYILGFADLGAKKTGDATYVSDGDNFYDICIQDPQAEVVGSIARIRMPCNGTKLYYPRGSKHWKGCADHKIDIDAIPTLAVV